MVYHLDGADKKGGEMSHTTTYKQKITDIEMFLGICKKLGFKVTRPKAGEYLTVNHYGRNGVEDAIASVQLSGWMYPLAIKANGEILYDHWGSKQWINSHAFGGKIQTMEILGKTLQEYYCQVIKQNIDYSSIQSEQTTKQNNGDIVITLEY
jgi:hypothetical protein